MGRTWLPGRYWTRKMGKLGGTPPGNPDGCENKAVAGKAIRIVVKTKDEQNSIPQRRGTVEATGVTDLQTEARKKSLYVADSKRWLREGIHPPPVFSRKRL